MPKTWIVRIGGKQIHSCHLYWILLQLRNRAVLLPNRLSPPPVRANCSLYEVRSLKRTKMRWTSGAGKSKENFFLWVTNFVSWDTAFERRHEVLYTHIYFLGYHKAVLVEMTHAFITQLIFTQFSSKIFNVHHEKDHPFLSRYWHGGSIPYNLRTIQITRNKMKTVFRETCIYC